MDPPGGFACQFPFRSILVAHDLSEHSAAALESAAQIARFVGASLHLVHVLEHASDHGAHEEARRRLEGLAGQLGAEVTLHLAEGSPPHAICELAAALRVDLIVMGTRGWSGFGRAVLGSAAVRTLLHAPAPVLIVRARSDWRRA